MVLLVFDNTEIFFKFWFFIRAVFSMALAHALFELGGVANLTLVLFERSEFDLPSISNVYRDIGLIGERHPDFVWHVRRIAFLE